MWHASPFFGHRLVMVQMGGGAKRRILPLVVNEVLNGGPPIVHPGSLLRKIEEILSLSQRLNW